MQFFFLGVEPDEGQAKKGHQSKEVDEGVSLHKRRRWEPPTTPPTPSRPRTRRSDPLGRRQPLKAQLPVETTVTNRTPTSETQAFVFLFFLLFSTCTHSIFHFHRRRLCVPAQLHKKSSWAFVRPALLSHFYDIAHDRSLRRLPFRQLFFILLPCYLLLLLRITPILLLLSVFFVMVFIHQLYSGPSYQQT